ncbi:MAG: hypothetical protein ACRDST_14905 [Pseudonocardiaceae bacterium]
MSGITYDVAGVMASAISMKDTDTAAIPTAAASVATGLVVMNPRDSATIRPQLELGGWSPRPRKLSVETKRCPT